MGEDCVQITLNASCSDVAEAIIKSKVWRFALNNYTCTQHGEMTSPFRKLIQRMPGSDRSKRNAAIVQHDELLIELPYSGGYEYVYNSRKFFS